MVAETLADEARAANPGEIKRMGKHPAIIPIAVDGGSRIEVAAATEDGCERALGPFASAPEAGASSPATL